ncbi:hypothetical protein [Streptomyces sp. NPDC059092]|uniref:hypothetical protein n=1 Tax=Streptomyces sp. NPDC059092 TaxID=3346725 RepID=UPI00368A8611
MTSKDTWSSPSEGVALETAHGLADAGDAITVIGRDPHRGRQAGDDPAGEFVQAGPSVLSTVRPVAAP